MKITNDLNLPEPIITAVQSDSYDKGDSDFTVTELISPPRIAVLKHQWDGHLSEDVSERIFILLGKSVHAILEHSAEAKRYIVEKRFFHEHDGYKISGQIDLFDRKTGNLEDWKVTSYHTTNEARLQFPWSTIRTVPADRGWIEQGNLNRYLMYRNGINVKAVRYVAIYRDFSKMQVHRGKANYPPRQVEILRIPLWSYGETEAYLSERIALHVEARTNLPMCTPDERWEKPPMWAVTKKDKKRAYRLMPSEAEAQQLAAEKSNGKSVYLVESRKGESTRCLYFCPVSGYCTFGRELLRQKAEEEGE